MIKSLKECKSIQEAEPLLKNARPSLRKVVETAFQLLNHPNPQQQEFGRGFLATAMREMDDGEQPDQPHDKGVKSKGDGFVKEEELAGGNPSGTQGSEQSSSNSEPVLSKEGTDEPDGDMAAPGMSAISWLSVAEFGSVTACAMRKVSSSTILGNHSSFCSLLQSTSIIAASVSTNLILPAKPWSPAPSSSHTIT